MLETGPAVFADLLRAPADDRWDYVTTGGTEGPECGLLLGRTLLPDAIAAHSAAAHYAVGKVIGRLRLPSVVVRADSRGVTDYDDLRSVPVAHRSRPTGRALTWPTAPTPSRCPATRPWVPHSRAAS